MNRQAGEKVRVKLLEDLKALSSSKDRIDLPSGQGFVEKMRQFCGKIVTITKVCIEGYRIQEDNGKWWWTDEMFEEVNVKQAIIHLEKVIVNGEECYKLLGWENVKKYSELPNEYFEERLYFYMTRRDGIFIHGARDTLSHFHHLSEIIKKEIWENEIYPTLKEAGKQLHKILQKKKWGGKVEVKI